MHSQRLISSSFSVASYFRRMKNVDGHLSDTHYAPPHSFHLTLLLPIYFVLSIVTTEDLNNRQLGSVKVNHSSCLSLNTASIPGVTFIITSQTQQRKRNSARMYNVKSTPSKPTKLSPSSSHLRENGRAALSRPFLPRRLGFCLRASPKMDRTEPLKRRGRGLR